MNVPSSSDWVVEQCGCHWMDAREAATSFGVYASDSIWRRVCSGRVLELLIVV